MPFEIQSEHQEQAKAILEDVDVDVQLNPIPNKRERRPGLDRKRKSFSLHLTTSQPPPVAPSFDPSKYPRSEDFFAAYDKFELANREWQKQTGSSVIDIQENPPSRRPRRPGIPGRKRRPFKESFTDSYFTDVINLEASEKEIPIASEQSLESATAAHVTTVDREVDDSTVDTDKDLNNVLKDLLACSREELEGDGAIKLLEERLQIKSFNIEKFSIPEFQDVRKMNLKASGSNPPNRKSLSDIQNILKGTNRVAVRKNSHSPSPQTIKHFSSPNPPVDQFSFPDIHNLLPGDQQPSEVNVQPIAKDIPNTSPTNVGTVDVASPFNDSVVKRSGEDDSHIHSGIHRSHLSRDGNPDICVMDSISNRSSAMLQKNVDMRTKGKEVDVPMSESGANRNTGDRENDAEINEETDNLERLAECASKEVTRPFTVEEDSIPYQQGASSKSPNRAPEQYNTMGGSLEHAEHNQGLHEEENVNTGSASGLQVENAPEVHKYSHKQTNKRRKRGSSDSNVKKRSKTVHGETGGDKQMKTLPHESRAKKQTKGKSNEREEKKPKKTLTHEGKLFSCRKSLAAAGTKIEGGVRRSTRIKSRPLEYWRGERFLYGRIHESLTTVIGIKYASPGEGKRDSRASKVKSFVSDEYKKLVDFAALH